MSGSAPDAVLVARKIVELACRAPSVHNTQPWTWRAGQDRIELYADWSRQLPASDPNGRNLMISCGTALHHAQVAASCLGFHATVTRFPDDTRRWHLATLALSPAEPDADAATSLRALDRRSTNRNRFTDWPVPDDRLRKVAASVTQQGVHGVALTEVRDRFRVELLVSQALRLQTHDEAVIAEQRLWIEHSNRDGVPLRSMPSPVALPHNQRSRFTTDVLDDGHPEVIIGSDGVIVLATETDDQSAWLRTGEALSSIWLKATDDDLAVVPLSQVIEVEETRQALRFDVLRGVAEPQILIRLGWQELGLSQRPRTPRRSVDDVLLAVSDGDA